MTALRNAPAAQVNLISYLWPLLMIGLLAVFVRQRPTMLQLAGSLIGFVGLGWFIAPGSAGPHLIGYLLAFGAACCFALYSALRKRFAEGPADAAGAACAIAAVIALALHLFGGGTMPTSLDPNALIAMILIGSGPMGVANLLWDQGVRHGDGRVLSAFAYMTPVLSTLLLVVLGLAQLDRNETFVGAALILTGIALAAMGGRKSDASC